MSFGLKFNRPANSERARIITQGFVVIIPLALALCATFLGAWVSERNSQAVLARDVDGAARFMSVLFEPLLQDLDQGNEITPENLATIRHVGQG